MAPDTALHSRSFARIVYFCIIGLTSLFSPITKTARPMQGFKSLGYCMSESESVAYFTPIYETKLNPTARIGTNEISREFGEYLMGRYDLVPKGGYRSSCLRFTRLSDAEASRSKFIAEVRQANKQVIDVDWKYVASEEMVAASYENPEYPDDALAQKRKSDHTYCVSDSVQGTLYTARPVNTGTGVNLSYWYRGFDQYLRQKYAFKGQVYCNVGSVQELGRLLDARVGGVRAAGKKIIDTGFKYDASAATVNNPAPAKQDNDPEPAQRPAQPNPSRQASDTAIKEMPASKAYCQKDPALPVVFNCDNFARVVYNYRMAHTNEAPEPLADLVTSKKLNCAECIDNTRVSLWVEKQAAADKLETRVTNCVSQNVIVTLYKTPEANRLKEFYKAAVATCSRQ
jgi:hypothetical protein